MRAVSPGIRARTRSKGFAMPSLIDRVTSFGRSPKGQTMFRQAMNRLTGDNDTRKGRRGGGANRRRRGTRRR
jgi:hypothetical protein